MLVAVWIAFLLVMLFLLGSAVGSFLNVCIVRLPQGRSLIRPPSSCGRCGQRIRMQDNIPLLSYWLLRGRCRSCGTAFSMRYFWIELLTGLVFVLLYWLEIGRNVHHFQMLAWYADDYEFLLMGMFRPRPWLVFAVHAILSCFLIVAAMSNHESHRVPRSVTVCGVLLGLLAAVLFPWPWPDDASLALVPPEGSRMLFEKEDRAFAWGPHVGAMANDVPWWLGDVTPHQGLYPWPVCGPLPDELSPGSRSLGLTTGVAGVLAGAILMGLVRLAFNTGTGTAALGWGETVLLMIAGGFVGWQPIIVAAVLGLVPGLLMAATQCVRRRRQSLAFSGWLALAVVAVLLGWYWIGPLMQGLFFNPTRLLVFASGWLLFLILLAAVLRCLTVVARRDQSRSMSHGHPAPSTDRALP